MAEMGPSALPSNFENKMVILQNYSKAPIRIIPSTGQQNLTPGDLLIMTLPVGCVLDLRTFALHFKAKTTGDATNMVGFPKYMQSLIDTLDIYVNGQNVQHIARYNQLYNLLQDWKVGYNEKVKKVGSNNDPSVLYSMTEAGVITKKNTYADLTTAGDIVYNTFDQDYVIDDWVGFLGSSQPSIIDTNLFGSIEIQMRLASADVCWVANAGTAGYEISNVYGYIDKLDFKDSRYYAIQESMLNGGGSLSIPYKNYRSYVGSELGATKTTTLRFTESTNSLDKIIFTYFEKNLTDKKLQLGDTSKINFTATNATTLGTGLNAGHYAANYHNYSQALARGDTNLLNTSKMFKRNGLGLEGGSVQFEINSQDMTTPMSVPLQYQETLKAFELNDADAAKINPGINSYIAYERDYYTCAFSTSHINGKSADDTFWLTGRNTQATSMNISVKAISGRAGDPAQKALPVCFTEMSAILQVGAGRQISIIF